MFACGAGIYQKIACGAGIYQYIPFGLPQISYIPKVLYTKKNPEKSYIPYIRNIRVLIYYYTLVNYLINRWVMFVGGFGETAISRGFVKGRRVFKA